MAEAKLRDGLIQYEAGLGKLSLGPVSSFKDPSHTGGQRVILTIPVRKSLAEVVDGQGIQVTVTFFNKAASGEILQLKDESWVKKEWVTKPLDWIDGDKCLQVTYTIAHGSGLAYYGQVVSLLYNGEVFDVQAWPRELAGRMRSFPGSTRNRTEVSSDDLLKKETGGKVTMNWHIVKIGETEYVNIDSVKRFYGFTKRLWKENELILENFKLARLSQLRRFLSA